MQRKQSLGKPDQKDLNENLAATQGLAHMIAECKKLFQVRRWEVLLFVKDDVNEDKILGTILVHIFFLAALCGTRNLSSQTGDWTLATCIERAES